MTIAGKATERETAVVPNGTYKARLSAIRRFQNIYGDRIGFEFALLDDHMDGVKVMRFTPPDLSPENELADVLRELLGRDIAQDEMSFGVDMRQMIGTECNVLVRQLKGRGGQPYSIVEKIFL